MHAVDSTIIHATITQGVAAGEHIRGVAKQPAPALRVAQIQPEIVDMQGKLTSRPQNPPRLRKRPAPRGPAANHSDRAEHRNGVVKTAIRHASQPAHIGLHPQHVHTRFLGLEPDNLEHARDISTAVTENSRPAK